MNSMVDEFLTSLVGTNNWNPQFAQMREWALSGQVEHLIAIAAALTEDGRTLGIEAMARNSLLRSLERTLALTPGISSAQAALVVLQLSEAQKTREAQRGPTPRRRTRQQHESELASLLAQVQPPEVTAALFERHGAEPEHGEMLACLVQEIVLRGAAVPSTAGSFWERRVVGGEHRLGRLPLNLLPQEREFFRLLPQYGPQTKSYAGPLAQAEGIKESIEPLPAPIEMSIRWAEASLPVEEKAAIGAATANWEEESNGMTEIRLFHADVSVPPAALTDTQVLSLPLESLAGAAAQDLWLVPYSAGDAVAVLFGAACTGGAYNQGLGGAYGRLAAWHSAAALAGAEPGLDVADAAAQVGACAWYFCIAKSKWFYDVAWDVGLLALRPDGRTLAALAATDTD